MPRRAGAEGPWRKDGWEVARKRVGAKPRAEPFLGLGLGLLQNLGVRLEDQDLGGTGGLGDTGPWSARLDGHGSCSWEPVVPGAADL